MKGNKITRKKNGARALEDIAERRKDSDKAWERNY